MNIPYSILKENIIKKIYYDYHQNLAKRYYNMNKNNKSNNTKKTNKYSKKKIYNWFFNLDIKNKLKICSIYNDWFIKILDQLLIYNYYDNHIRFKPTRKYENFYNINDFDNFVNKNNSVYINDSQQYFNTFFEGKGYDNNSKGNKNIYTEREFLNELRFFSLNNTNDILSLNEDLLNNKAKLQEYFDKFSDCKIFSENIKVIKTNNNIYNFSFPNWIKDMQEGFSVHQLIIICFEISISIYYQIFLVEQIIPKFEIDSKIEELYNMKLNMENYLAKETSNMNNQINSILDINKLDMEVNLDTTSLIEHDKIEDYVYRAAFNRNQSSFFTDENHKNNCINNAVNNLKKELNNNIPKFVDIITFIKADNLFKIENKLYNIIYHKIITLYSNRGIDELFNDINEISTSKKKKKKNKKNKNEKKKENEIHESEEEKEKIQTKENNEQIDINLNKYYEENEINNIDDNKFSINCCDNKNNSNKSEEEDEEENNPFPNEISNSKNITNINNNKEDTKEFIEMKDLDEKGKEIFKEKEQEKEKEKEKKSENDLILESLLEDTKEKKNNSNNNNKKKKKKRKNKNKNKNENQEESNKEIKEEEKIEEKTEISKEETNNINNNSPKKNEINISINNDEQKTKDKSKIENKNTKKHKDFFLYPTNKKNNNKNTNINNKNNSNNKNNIDKDENRIITTDETKENKSQLEASENIEKNENIDNKNNNCDIIILSNKKVNFVETKESDIVIIGNYIQNKKSMNSTEKSNIIEHTQEYSKIQNFNLNNSTINNYVIIDKISSNKSNSIENKDFQKEIFPQVLSPFNYSMPFHQLPNYYLYEKNELFGVLTEEIVSHEEKITNNLKLLEKYRNIIYEKIKNVIENVLNKNNFEWKFINYGSHETGLSIECSDIDILIKFCKKDNINNIFINNQQNIEEILSLLYNELNLEKEKLNIYQINPISTASVPVLKIKINLEKIIPNEIQKKIKENYIFNFEEDILLLNFDFTFQEVENMYIDIKIPSLEIIPVIKEILFIYKAIKPIILILKRFMKINILNSSFHGGLSSYSLFLLLYAYIKTMFIPNNSIGHYLYGFFEFYSNFNFGIYLINPILDCPFMILDELHESGMMLIDPITSLNVAKSTFRIDQIKSVFTKGMIILRNIFLTNNGKDYIHNLNDKEYIFLNELFKSRKKTMIFDKIIPQIHKNNTNVLGTRKKF